MDRRKNQSKAMKRILDLRLRNEKIHYQKLIKQDDCQIQQQRHFLNMVDSRLRVDPPTLFHCLVDITSPSAENALHVNFMVPQEFEDKDVIIKQIRQFCYPCTINHDGVQYSTFVLTDLESKFRFGFCRYPPHAKHCLCLISYLPWFETFYAVLDKISLLSSADGDGNLSIASQFLHVLNQQPIPPPGSRLNLKLITHENEKLYQFDIPDTTKLPTIPENRNLTEYFAKVSPENMVNLFVSMLFERRIIVTSEKLSVLTAVVHGSVALLYPMQWQHIYIPILPPELIDYCSAPMPYLVGVHLSLMPKVRRMPLDEVVIFNADTDEISMREEDRAVFPSKMATKLRKKLERTEMASRDYVSGQFLNVLADLIGGYREALKFTETKDGGKIVFDDEAFLNSRTGAMKDFLEHILNLQSFRQFVAGRLDMLNDGVEFIDIFEQAVLTRDKNHTNETKLNMWKGKMKKGSGALQKTLKGKYSHLKGIANEIEVKDIKNKIKGKIRNVKEVIKNKESHHETESVQEAKVKRNNSMPAVQKQKVNITKGRHSMYMYSTLPKQNTPKPGKTPPPRPPQPADVARRASHKETSSAELPRKELLNVQPSAKYLKSNSEANIADLLVVDKIGDDPALAKKSSSLTTLDYSDSDSLSSLEHLGSYANPAFFDHHDRTLSEASEGPQLEHTPIPQSSASPDTVLLNNNETRPNTLVLQNDTQNSESVHKTNHSLKRGTPVKPKRPQMPPARPPPISPTKKTPPSRPPVPTSRQINDIANFEDSFVVLHENDKQQAASHMTGSLVPNSPFYTPSSDLLELDQSLFHETMMQLSESTRELMSKDGTDDSNSSAETYDIIELSASPTIDVNIAFPSDTEQNTEVLKRSEVMTNNPRRTCEHSLNQRKPDSDPFANLLEDAKKKMGIPNKR